MSLALATLAMRLISRDPRIITIQSVPVSQHHFPLCQCFRQWPMSHVPGASCITHRRGGCQFGSDAARHAHWCEFALVSLWKVLTFRFFPRPRRSVDAGRVARRRRCAKHAASVTRSGSKRIIGASRGSVFIGRYISLRSVILAGWRFWFFNSDVQAPRRIDYLVSKGVVVVQIAAGYQHLAVLTSKGHIFGFSFSLVKNSFFFRVCFCGRWAGEVLQQEAGMRHFARVVFDERHAHPLAAAGFSSLTSRFSSPRL